VQGLVVVGAINHVIITSLRLSRPVTCGSTQLASIRMYVITPRNISALIDNNIPFMP